MIRKKGLDSLPRCVSFGFHSRIASGKQLTVLNYNNGHRVGCLRYDKVCEEDIYGLRFQTIVVIDACAARCREAAPYRRESVPDMLEIASRTTF